MKQLEKRVKEICDYLNNYFVDEIHEKTFVIENGVLDLSGITILNNAVGVTCETQCGVEVCAYRSLTTLNKEIPKH